MVARTRVRPLLLVAICVGAGVAGCAPVERLVGWMSMPSDEVWVPPEPAPEAWIAFFHRHGQLLDVATMGEWKTRGGAVTLDGVDGSTFPTGSFGVSSLGGAVTFANIPAMRSLYFLSGVEALARDNRFSGPDLASLDGLQDVASVGMGSDTTVSNTHGGRIGGLRAIEMLRWVAWGGGLSIGAVAGSSLRMTQLGAPSGSACRDLGSLELFDHEIRTLVLQGNGLFGSLAIVQGPLADLTGIAPGVQLCDLYLGGNQIVDVAPLAAIGVRETLSLSDNPLSDLRPLAGASHAPTLLWLSLAQTRVSDLAPLTGYSALVSLDISDTRVSDLEPLRGRADLATLGLGNLALGQAALDVFKTLPALSRIDGNLAWASQGITDLSGLSGVRDLGREAGVDLSGNALASLTGLERVNAVGKTFDLRGNTGLTSVSGLAGLRFQEGSGRLYLPERLADISGLSGFVGDATAPDTLVLPVPSLITVRAAAASPLCGAIDAGTVLVENGTKADVCSP